MDKLKKYFQLVLGIFAIISFMILANRLQDNSTSLQKVRQEIDRQGIESDALFYTESPRAMEAGFLLQQKTQ